MDKITNTISINVDNINKDNVKNALKEYMENHNIDILDGRYLIGVNLINSTNQGANNTVYYLPVRVDTNNTQLSNGYYPNVQYKQAYKAYQGDETFQQIWDHLNQDNDYDVADGGSSRRRRNKRLSKKYRKVKRKTKKRRKSKTKKRR